MDELFRSNTQHSPAGYECVVLTKRRRVLMVGHARTPKELREFLDGAISNSYAECVRIYKDGHEVGTCGVGLVRFYKRVYEERSRDVQREGVNSRHI